MCGMDTDGCVLLSAMDAFEFGYVPVVFGDLCMSSGGQAFHTSAIHILKRSLGRRNVVLSTSISLTQKKLRAFLKFLYSLFS